MRSSIPASDVWTAVRVARLGGIAALVITTVLAILVLDEPIVLLFLLPAAAGGLAGTVWGRSTPILILSAMLVVATAFIFLSIGVGLIYIPAIVLLWIGAAMNLKPPK
jgi:hypothetical protein